MNFSSEHLLRAVAKASHATSPTERSMPAAKTKFDGMLYSAARAHFDLVVAAAKASGAKTVQLQHVLHAAKSKSKTATATKTMRGGAETVLPSEYFGKNSGAYFPQEATAGIEHSAFAPGVTRAGLPATSFMAGGMSRAGKGGRCPCMLGGAETVLPSEYFGRNSGAYVDASQSAQSEHTAMPTATLTRGPLPTSAHFGDLMGGSASSGAKMSDELLTQLWREYRQRNISSSGMRIAREARGALREALIGSVVSAVGAEQKKHRDGAITASRLAQAVKRMRAFK